MLLLNLIFEDGSSLRWTEPAYGMPMAALVRMLMVSWAGLVCAEIEGYLP